MVADLKKHPMGPLTMIAFTTSRVAILSVILLLSVISIRTENTSFRLNAYQSFATEEVQHDSAVMQLDNQELKYLNFGTSVSWGAGLKDRFDAYPFLLSPNVTNLAIRAQGPCFPSVCTQTMVGHEAVYDVITLEFFTRSSQGLVRLAKRLRTRFPKAVIVVIRRWNPMVYQHVPTNQNFADWMEQHGYKRSEKVFDTNNPKLYQELYSKTLQEDWEFHVDQEELLAQQQAVESAGAVLLDLPRPSDFRQAIAETSHWFAPDMNHLSEEGHVFLAAKIQQLITHSNLMDMPGRDKVGPWDSDDHCQSWFLTGDSELERDENSVRMVEFDTVNHKWALEVSPSGGWVTVMNPFDKTQSLFLTYMVTGPPPSIYPEVFVHVGEGEDHGTVVLIDPQVDHPGPQEHVGKTTFVGVIPPGETTLRFEYWQKDEILTEVMKKPFRLTGYAIVGLDHDDLGSNYQDQYKE